MRRPVYNSLMSEKQFGDNLQYQNITISGLPGCGSTTLLNGLRQLLSPYGWRGFSGGEFMRAYAQEKGLWDKKNAAHHDANVYSDEFDREVDFGIREKLQQQKQWIIESWLSGFMAQQLPGVLKVLLVCHSDDVRIDRVMNRDQVSAETAKENSIESQHRRSLLQNPRKTSAPVLRAPFNSTCSPCFRARWRQAAASVRIAKRNSPRLLPPPSP